MYSAAEPNATACISKLDKKLRQRFADPTVVVYDENDVILSIHLCDSAAREGSQSATFDISVLECGCCELRRDTHI